jgi:type II secretory pathway pseudopilin PulG
MRGRHAGFTLVELLVSAALFATVIVALLSALVSAAALTEESKNLTQAVDDARTVLERIRDDVQASADITAFAAAFPASTYEDWAADQQVAGTGFTGLTEEAVTVTYGAAGDDPLEVTVVVAWTGRAGRAQSTTLQTEMTRR